MKISCDKLLAPRVSGKQISPSLLKSQGVFAGDLTATLNSVAMVLKRVIFPV
ncbi:hypothetical protein yinte0001_42060 [Yersinia intermedia ATCC 29909]|nr:hypothetical protein yinte0001_42060 [Yersinia intermedia ATCC 29909]